ncbi:MAG: two-component system cell cycle response regulator DivK [Lentisphaeria bacterium]|jgi:two-component system cell cycle response regulator DivK
MPNSTILIVEDNADNRQLTTWILEDAGYEVNSAETAEEGIEMLSKTAYDLVLMDISLPGMDGKQACKEIRANSPKKDVPIIALTGYCLPEEQALILSCGANVSLCKPAEEEELLAQVSLLLGK